LKREKNLVQGYLIHFKRVLVNERFALPLAFTIVQCTRLRSNSIKTLTSFILASIKLSKTFLLEFFYVFYD